MRFKISDNIGSNGQSQWGFNMRDASKITKLVGKATYLGVHFVPEIIFARSSYFPDKIYSPVLDRIFWKTQCRIWYPVFCNPAFFIYTDLTLPDSVPVKILSIG